jgi:hypothetical protein
MKAAAITCPADFSVDDEETLAMAATLPVLELIADEVILTLHQVKQKNTKITFSWRFGGLCPKWPHNA